MLSKVDIALATRLREQRVQIGPAMTQKVVAEGIGIRPSVLAGYEGTTENSYRQPNLEMLCRLADYYCVSTDYLLGRDDYASQEHKKIDELAGIGREAIDTLITFNDGYTNKIISSFIECDYFLDFLEQLRWYVTSKLEKQYTEREVEVRGRKKKVKVEAYDDERIAFANFIAISLDLAKNMREKYIAGAKQSRDDELKTDNDSDVDQNGIN